MSEDGPAAPPPPSPPARRRSRLLDPFLLSTLAAILLITLIRPLFVREAPPPPVGAPVPSFSLVDEHGLPFGSAELAGRTWVAALLPPEPAEKASRAFEGLLRLAAAWRDAGREMVLVAVATAPERQTPESLRVMAAARGVDLARLKLLTGPAGSTCGLAAAFVEGGGPARCDALGALAERGRLLMVDASGRSRGLYHADPLGLEEVNERARGLGRED